MQYILKAPGLINTTIALPASKSISNRALMIQALAGGSIFPTNLSDCDDTRVIIDALRDMPEVIDIKAAGTAMRFMTAYLAVTEGRHVLTGTERMKHRPIGVLVDALRQLGAHIDYVGEEGFPPLRIEGRPLEGGYVEVPGDISSQFISALLMIGPVLKNGLELKMRDGIISRSYIDMTRFIMMSYGAEVDWTDIDTIRVEPKPYEERAFLIENDWSASSYWYEMLLLNNQPDSEIRLTGLADSSRQGDSSVRYIFSLLGVKTIFASKQPGTPTTITLRKSGHHVPRLDYDFTNSPDLAQTLVATCCAMGVPFHFSGLQTLKIKETDRIVALTNELAKLGYTLTAIGGRELAWDGQRHHTPTGTGHDIVINTYADHRMALAFAPLALKHPIAISDPQVVTKSYPQFWKHLEQAGFTIDKTE